MMMESLEIIFLVLQKYIAGIILAKTGKNKLTCEI